MEPTRRQMARWLEGGFPGGDGALAAEARRVMLEEVGPEVHLRGLLEFSNLCRCDCYYCGIRLGRDPVPARAQAQAVAESPRRFTLSEEEILQAAHHSLESGFGSMTLQSGERRDEPFVRFVEGVLRRIKAETATAALPQGLGITLCVGEQSPEAYRRFFEAGAHRYLLRIESTNPELFARLHPPHQRLEERIAALRSLKEIGYQVGTGVMIGVPGQTAEDLARDIAFYREIDADMIGMGPYIPAGGTAGRQMRLRGLLPTLDDRSRLILSLRMIAVTRIVLRDVNIAATTALQALSPRGREAGLAFGANVLMPIVTPGALRSSYQLYDGKPCIDEESDACRDCTIARVVSVGRPVSTNRWGDAPHATRNGRSVA